MVEDVNRTIEFYKDVLGFELLVTVPEAGQFNWAMLKCGNVEIMFQTRASLSEEIPTFKDKAIGGTLTLYIDVEDIKGLHASIKDKATIVQDMHTTFYGSQEFAIQDCNGFVLAFSQPS